MNLSLMSLEVTGINSSSELLDELSLNLFDLDAGFGFRDLDLENEHVVSGYAVMRRPIFVKVFDVDQGQVVQREEFLLTEIFFRLNMIRGVAEIYSGPRDLKYAVQIFRQTVGEAVKLMPTSELVPAVLSAMKRTNDYYEITQIEIIDFEAEKGVVGKFAIRAIDPAKAWEFVSRYGTQIKAACVILNGLGSKAVIHVMGSGRFRISVRPESATADIVDSLSFLVKK